MQSGVPPTSPMDAKGLPPVTPPSGKFIAQLFVVPGVIVAVAVGCIWFVTWLVGGFFSPDQFLKDLKSGNSEVRWRRASDLAQVLKRDPALAANPQFALSLTELLHQALRDSAISEKAAVERNDQKPQSEKSAPDKELENERAFIEFLIACVGNFSVPVGLPLLNEIALKTDGANVETIAMRRQLAVWSLANLGDNLKRIDSMTPQQRSELDMKLAAEIESSSSERSQWARTALELLKHRADRTLGAMNVDQTLARCAADDNPRLRKLTAVALRFWEGTPEENARIENALVTLAKDDGRGPDPAETDEQRRTVRYQAVQSLALRGSPKTIDQIGTLDEMLNEDLLAKSFHSRDQKGQYVLKDGHYVPDASMVSSTLTGALKGITELHQKKPALDLSPLYPAIDKLAKSPNPVLSQEAERTSIALNRK